MNYCTYFVSVFQDCKHKACHLVLSPIPHVHAHFKLVYVLKKFYARDSLTFVIFIFSADLFTKYGFATEES
jgi:hypothetical protein